MTLTRIPYIRGGYLCDDDILILSKRGGGERRLPAHKWWIDRHTPVGEDADLCEKKPYGGVRIIDRKQIIAIERP